MNTYYKNQHESTFHQDLTQYLGCGHIRVHTAWISIYIYIRLYIMQL